MSMDRLLKTKRQGTIFSKVPITFRFLTNKVKITGLEADLALK